MGAIGKGRKQQKTGMIYVHNLYTGRMINRASKKLRNFTSIGGKPRNIILTHAIGDIAQHRDAVDQITQLTRPHKPAILAHQRVRC